MILATSGSPLAPALRAADAGVAEKQDELKRSIKHLASFSFLESAMS
jgi:hypothetical protein